MFGVEETSNLYFATQAKSVSEGLDQQLEGFIREHPDVRLIIIDTLQKVREIGGDRYSYASDYEIVTKLKTFQRQVRHLPAGGSSHPEDGSRGQL